MSLRSLIILCLIGLTPVLAYDKFWYPCRRAQDINTLTAEDFTQAKQSGQTVVVHFTVPNTDDPEAQEMDRINEHMFQTAAQSLASKNVSFGRMNMVENPNLADEAGVVAADTIVVFCKGRQHVYWGHRSAQPLITFINTMERPFVSVIENKLQKKAFDHISSTKVIGYFQAWPTTDEMVAFEAAAKSHYPSIPFLAVITQELATSMRFTSPGEIQIVRPFEKTSLVLPQNPATEADISAFLASEGKPCLRRVSLEDLHCVWANAGEDRVVAFIRETSAEGKALAKTFKNMAKYGMLRNATDRTILLIDPDNFPVLVDHWQALFNFDLTLPALGLLNVTDNTASWADLTEFSTMNMTDQIALVTLWLEAVSSGKVRVDSTTPVPTQDELQAMAKEASEMALKAMEAAKRAAKAAEAAAASFSSSQEVQQQQTGGEETQEEVLEVVPQTGGDAGKSEL